MRSRIASLAVLAACLAASEARAQSPCLPDCSNQTLTMPNFSHYDLTNANFTGATIIGASFVRANLTGAKFDGAKFQAVPGNPTQTPDFAFANLTSASFTNAQFLAPTYFAGANLNCADFSKTNINNGNVFFGDDPLVYDKGGSCRPKFQQTMMSCEFVNDWKGLDMTGAVVTACLKQLSNRDFSGAIFTSVDFTGAVLDGDNFAKANLQLAVLNGASLQCLSPGNPGSQCVDLSNALLQGARLNNANLSGASLYKAFLSNDVNGKITQAATLQQAHLRNVNLAFAQLSGVDFTLANFYGSNFKPANPNGCAATGGKDPSNPDDNKFSGFTAACASAHGATLTGTKFIDSYLYGVDFTNATISGANFYQAILAGANFADAKITTNTADASVTSFSRAYLQGTNLDKANTLAQADLSNAFFDFRHLGNFFSITLSGADHNQFAPCSGPPNICKVPAGQDVCVFVQYPETTVPAGNPTITCPNGTPAGSNGCGSDFSPGTSAWKSHLTIGAPPNPGPPPGWYSDNATFEPAAPGSAVCNKKGPAARVSEW